MQIHSSRANCTAWNQEELLVLCFIKYSEHWKVLQMKPVEHSKAYILHYAQAFFYDFWGDMMKFHLKFT
jgi:hypothetical protein